MIYFSLSLSLSLARSEEQFAVKIVCFFAWRITKMYVFMLTADRKTSFFFSLFLLAMKTVLFLLILLIVASYDSLFFLDFFLSCARGLSLSLSLRLRLEYIDLQSSTQQANIKQRIIFDNSFFLSCTLVLFFFLLDYVIPSEVRKYVTACTVYPYKGEEP